MSIEIRQKKILLSTIEGKQIYGIESTNYFKKSKNEKTIKEKCKKTNPPVLTFSNKINKINCFMT